MKKSLLLATLCAATTAFGADHYVGGYIKRDGTYVPPHMQTDPNATPYDNYSTKGNINPYTGREGTVDPYRTFTPTRPYGSEGVKPLAPRAPESPYYPYSH